MYAIIATGGKQYKVEEGDCIKVEKLDAEVGSEITIDTVLAVKDADLKCGNDVANASVTATVMDQGKGKKVIVYKYKRKSGYHKKNGHRQLYTQIKIDKINA
ncbi:MAG: 50S ribosomal protein L21 [Lachnospiraceae bacterium]|nr:50S ribosomal protein L21 [Lachnospiraceae bacterium]